MGWILSFPYRVKVTELNDFGLLINMKVYLVYLSSGERAFGVFDTLEKAVNYAFEKKPRLKTYSEHDQKIWIYENIDEIEVK